MKQLRGLTGMPVVCRGRKIGRLLRGELSGDLTRLSGIWVSAGIRGARWIPSEELQLIGQVAVLSDGRGVRGRMSAPSLPRRATSTDGQRLGAIVGALIDEVSFAVTALELSLGFWDDLLSGRRWVSRYTANRENGEVVIDAASWTREGERNEERHDQGLDRGHDDRLRGGDGIWRNELADREEMEPEGQDDRQLDRGSG